jgi:hypothetical protein
MGVVLIAIFIFCCYHFGIAETFAAAYYFAPVVLIAVCAFYILLSFSTAVGGK